jgi:hypothetical protein
MKKNNFNIVVEYTCDGDLNHKAPISECITSNKKSFNSELKAVSFINECTFVYNLSAIKQELGLYASHIKERATNINQLIN